MSTRKTTLIYAVLIAFAAGMVIASRLDLSPMSSAQSLTMPQANSAPITGTLDAQTFRNVAKAQQPTVVNIRTESPRRGTDISDFFGGRGIPDDLAPFFGPDGPGGQGRDGQGGRGGQGGGSGRSRREPPPMTAAGTGFIVNKDGLILTNNHVVEDATKISVYLFGEDNDQSYEAKLVGRDSYSDTALIQLVQKPDHALPEAKFGDSSQMAAGDWVMAIGNPFNQGWTVTVGVISAVQRPFDISDGRQTEMIQTDAAINPGNSGGPLLNLRGEVIGINTAIYSSGRAEGNIGIGFAVPINTVRDLLPQLSTGKVVRGRIGVQIDQVPREGFEEFGLKSRTGAIVRSVVPDGPADKGGIEAGDVIVEFNGKAVTNTSELQKMVAATKPGTAANVKLIRSKKEQTLRVTIEELNLETEQQGLQGRAPQAPTPDVQGQESFGITLTNVTPATARRMQLPAGVTGALVTDVDPNGPAADRLVEGDIILSVNQQRVANASEAGRELQRVQAGRSAQVLVWREDRRVFVTIRKE